MKCPYCKAEMTETAKRTLKKLGVIKRYFHCPTHGTIIIQTELHKYLEIPDPYGDIERICRKIRKELKKENPKHNMLIHQAVRIRNVSNERRDDYDTEIDQAMEKALDGNDFYTLAALVFSMFQAHGGMQIKKTKLKPKNIKIELPELSNKTVQKPETGRKNKSN